MATSEIVGRVAGLWRYPVKSMAGEALDSTEVSWHGVAGDRRWGFVRPDRAGNGFPWLTIRQRPEMVLYRPSLTEPTQPDRSPTVVRTPSGDEFDILDPALAARLGDGVRVMKLDRGTFDALPLSLLTTRSAGDFDVRRFRPNVLVEAVGDTDFPEDAWVGRVLRVGGVRMRIDRRDGRCAVVNVDPVTGERDPSVLRTIVRERENFLGVYGSTVEPGLIRVGDLVRT